MNEQQGCSAPDPLGRGRVCIYREGHASMQFGDGHRYAFPDPEEDHMDPNANIARQRELARTISSGDGPPEDDENNALELAELVIALDEWRLKGGFDPYA